MAANCTTCGVKLGIGRRVSGKAQCQDCEDKAAAAERAAQGARDSAIAEYTRLAQLVAYQPAAGDQLSGIAQQAGLTDRDIARARVGAFRAMMDKAVEDEFLTVEEEAALDRTSNLLALPDEVQISVAQGMGNRLWIALMNAGRMTALTNCSIVLKPGEQAYLEVSASLLKEVVHRETRGAYRGVSIRVAKGVRFNTGGYRGKSVVVGTSLEAADTGVLCVTSHRAVFKGLRQSVESQFTKLLGINVFDAGIQFHVSNRQKATLLRVPDGYLVAAAVNAVVQRT